MDLTWKGEGADEIGIDANTGRVIIRIDPYFYRPSEVDMLVGNYAKAKKQLAWEPKVRFDELVKLMLDSDLENEARGELIGDGPEG
jgi:GDPmannose 4,6-dehydratase